MITALPRILLISTGGTITMTADRGNGVAPTISGRDLVSTVSDTARLADIDIVEYSMKPGASLTLDDIVYIAHLIDSRIGEGFAGAIVVQGTDTIEETAFVLDTLVTSNRPVVVTGAMRGPGAPGADGPANIMGSVIVASDDAASALGTLVVLNDEIHAARYAQKTHTSLPSAFASPGFAPIGRIIEGRANLYLKTRRLPILGRPSSVEKVSVALVKVCLGDDGRLIDSLPGLGYAGAVIEAMGAGHLPECFAAKVSDLARVMPVVLATRVASGPVFERTYGFVGSEMDLISRGVIPAGDLAGNKACLLLRLLLASNLNGDEVRAGFIARSKVSLGNTDRV